MLSSREESVELAKVAEQAERYEDMREIMDKVVSDVPASGLTLEERKLLSNAYKTVTGNLRKSWRVINEIERREASKEQSPVLHLVRRNQKIVLDQLHTLCYSILENISQLLPTATTAECRVFYHKMTGDYQRYLAESAGETRSTLVAESLESYKAAWEIAVSQLPETDPTRLGLALNFSVFYFELLESPDRACHVAKHAFDAALEKLDELPESDAADSIQILQLLKNNLSMWLEQMEIFPPQAESPS